ncbi:energy-coupled thiamine transporter ThiT [Sporosarcina saromensis]|uniref:Energy-coupled thiamine transporter ThiT n=1 Tax=Sporosarcina saromensis TaxID=359365 RepID=A0ABU4GE75_9BACL|nr:energy-coupled thiamine transporter ThiT [Sporosarcina saromensis]MDW0114623.1 energy-coupled thiamine transporter ThiT [Sporosarcina saromensis]
MDRSRLQFLLEVAILGAMSFVLDNLTVFKMPQGGSVTLSMLPIILMAFRWGLSGGLLTGLISGLLQAVIGGYIIHPVQGALDYFIAYTVVGLAAVTLRWLLKSKAEGKKGSMATAIIVGSVLGGSLRFLAHFIGGMVFFAEYAGDQPAWLYSLGYNASYMIPSIVLCAIVAVLLFTSAPRLIQRN